VSFVNSCRRDTNRGEHEQRTPSEIPPNLGIGSQPSTPPSSANYDCNGGAMAMLSKETVEDKILVQARKPSAVA